MAAETADQVAAAVQAERERIRLALLACARCGKVHEYRPETCDCGKPHVGGSHAWADPGDGHAYHPAYFGHDVGDFIRATLGEYR